MKRVRSAIPALISALALLALAVPTSANIGPSGDIYIHVKPWDGQMPQVHYCSEVVQHTTQAGWLEFDLFLYDGGGFDPYGVRNLEVTLHWPASWDLDAYEIPYGGEGEVSDFEDHAVCNLSWPDCPPQSTEVKLLLRLGFWVGGPGELWSPDSDLEVPLCPPYDYNLSHVDVRPAGAGVVCGYPQAPCDFMTHCLARADSPLIELAAIPGELVVQNLHFSFLPAWSSCFQGICHGTADWMQVSGEFDSDHHGYAVTLQVNTADLAPGDYSGWVQVDSDGGRGCTEVLLHVLTATGVPPVDDAASWSLIKSFY